MKKILFLFALTMLFALGASAQSYPTTIQVDPDSTTNTIEAVDVFDTLIGTTTVYVFDYDSIVSIDSVFDPHHTFLGMDTVYLCTDTLEVADTNIVPVPGFHNYLAVADSGWMFDHWVIIVPYLDSTDNTLFDTAFSFTEFLGDDLDDEFWMDWPGIPDSTDEVLGAPIQITAYFVTDTNTVGIRDIQDAIFTIYPNPTSDNVTVLGDVRTIHVYDMSGRIVMETNKPVVDLRSQPKGTYIFRVTNTRGQVGITKVTKR